MESPRRHRLTPNCKDSTLCARGTLFASSRCSPQQYIPIYLHQQLEKATPGHTERWAWCPCRLCKVSYTVPDRKSCLCPCDVREGGLPGHPSRRGRVHARSHHRPSHGTPVDQPTSDVETSDSSTCPIDRSPARDCRQSTFIHHSLCQGRC